MGEGFFLGFEKRAAPKWIKMLKGDPSKFLSQLHPPTFSGNFNKSLAESAIPAGRKAITSITGFGRNTSPHIERSLSDPIRRKLYVKRNGDWLRMEPRIPKTGDKEFQKQLIDNLSKKTESTGKFLKNKDLKRPGSQDLLPYRNISSKKNVSVTHKTVNPEGMLGAKNINTQSASRYGLPRQGVYTFPEGSKDVKRVWGGKSLVSKVPERSVTYLPNQTTRARNMSEKIQDMVSKPSPEIFVPQKEFKEGLGKK